MIVSHKWTQAMTYAKQAAQFILLREYENASHILVAFRAYQAQWEENSIEWWLCTEAFEDEWNWYLKKNICHHETPPIGNMIFPDCLRGDLHYAVS